MSEVDIQYDKTIEWLLARRKLPEGWATTLKGIQAKIRMVGEQNIGDDAADAYVAKHSEVMGFMNVEELWELVAKSKEGQKKNIIGRHTAPQVKAWKSVVDNYRKDNVYLADLAKEMIQSARYDAPAVKKQADACQKQLQDATRRQQELLKTEAEAKKNFRRLCEQHGIPGVQFKTELQERVRTELPQVLAEGSKLLEDKCPAALGYYSAFISYTDGKAVNESQVLPFLRFVIKNGNVSMKEAAKFSTELADEWKKVQAESKKTKTVEKEESGGIDWGFGASDGGGGGIDWGFGGSGDDSAGDSGGGGISWDFAVEDSGAQDSGEATAAVSSGGIDWGGISLEGLDISAAAAADPEEDSGDVSLLENSKARNLLVDEILELEAFLAQRVWELKNQRGAESQLAQSGNLEIQISLDEVKGHHAGVSSVCEALAGKRAQSIIMMRNSEAALGHAVTQLTTQRALCEKPSRQHSVLEKRKAELQEEAQNCLAEASRLRAETRRIQQRLESDIGTVIKGKVRIVGDINRI